MMALIWDGYVVLRGSRCRRVHIERERVPRALVDGAFAAGGDVGVLREAVDVVVDAVGVPGACAECGEGTSDGPGPLRPLPGLKGV